MEKSLKLITAHVQFASADRFFPLIFGVDVQYCSVAAVTNSMCAHLKAFAINKIGH
jgi:hypothetical protein